MRGSLRVAWSNVVARRALPHRAELVDGDRPPVPAVAQLREQHGAARSELDRGGDHEHHGPDDGERAERHHLVDRVLQVPGVTRERGIGDVEHGKAHDLVHRVVQQLIAEHVRHEADVDRRLPQRVEQLRDLFSRAHRHRDPDLVDVLAICSQVGPHLLEVSQMRQIIALVDQLAPEVAEHFETRPGVGLEVVGHHGDEVAATDQDDALAVEAALSQRALRPAQTDAPERQQADTEQEPHREPGPRVHRARLRAERQRAEPDEVHDDRHEQQAQLAPQRHAAPRAVGAEPGRDRETHRAGHADRGEIVCAERQRNDDLAAHQVGERGRN